MLSLTQVNTMLVLRQREKNILSPLPTELFREIVGWANGDIAQALKYAAYARKEDVGALLKMLEADPNLLLDAGDVKTPGGDVIKKVTIYELVLGAGDYELAKKVQSYFSKIRAEDPEKLRLSQYERYKPHIDGMLKQEPYDLEPLIQLIKESPAEDVTALLNKDMKHASKLRDAMIQFRTDWAPRILTEPCMHYNYASLQHAFKLLSQEWLNLVSRNNCDKLDLVWRQLIGFEMRRLPGIDRCVMAQGLCYVIEQQVVCSRSYKFRNSGMDCPIMAGDDSLDGLGGDFPIMAGDDSLDGLGGDFSVGVYGRPTRWAGGVGWTHGAALVEKLMSNKNFKLAELMQSQPEYQPTRCLIL